MATNNYVLGRGKVYFDRWDENNAITGERYVGNTPSLSFNITVDKLEHFSSDVGIKEKDDEAVRQVTRAGTLSMDDMQPENLALFFFGSSETVTSTAVTAATYTILGVIPGLSYQVGTTISLPSGVRNITSTDFSLKDSPGTTTYVKNTDYSLDNALGRITILEGGAITSGSTVVVTYSTVANVRDRIISGSDPVVGAIRFITYNPKGANRDVYMPYVSVTPNGDYALKGDEWQQMTFSLEVLKKSGYQAFYVDGRPDTSVS